MRFPNSVFAKPIFSKTGYATTPRWRKIGFSKTDSFPGSVFPKLFFPNRFSNTVFSLLNLCFRNFFFQHLILSNPKSWGWQKFCCCVCGG